MSQELQLQVGCSVVGVQIADEPLREHVASRLRDLVTATTEPPSTVIEMRRTPNTPSVRFGLFEHDQPLLQATSRAMALDHLVAWCNTRAARSAATTINVHAAALVAPGTDRAVVIAAPSGSGKSTLAAVLAQHGWGYLSDEVIAIDRSTNEVTSYAKPLTFKIGTRELLERRGVRLGSMADAQQRWYARPDELGGHVVNRARVHAIVIAQHSPAHTTELTPAGPVATLMGLIYNAQTSLDQDGTGFGHLARLVCGVHRRALSHDDLDEAVDALAQLAEQDLPDAGVPPEITRIDPPPADGARLHAPRARPEILAAQMSDGAVLFDPVQQQLVALDILASGIWPDLDGHKTIDELAEDYAAIFDAPAALVRQDLDSLVAELKTEGFLLPG